uniref:Uncharacterized protein n=1 Tax=Anguilla anguilla TaxID=7936 RepID=A0A0E9P6W6_ANGAN
MTGSDRNASVSSFGPSPTRGQRTVRPPRSKQPEGKHATSLTTEFRGQSSKLSSGM